MTITLTLDLPEEIATHLATLPAEQQNTFAPESPLRRVHLLQENNAQSLGMQRLPPYTNP